MSMLELSEFDFYLQWEWPEHIETALRRLLWVSLVEQAEDSTQNRSHTTYLRFLISVHPESPAEVLEFLTRFDDVKLLLRVAEHTNACAATLEKLSLHKDSQVVLAVCQNPSAPPQVLSALTTNKDVDVRYSLAENPHLPRPLLQTLALDDNVYVKARAERTLARQAPCSVANLPVRANAGEIRQAM